MTTGKYTPDRITQLDRLQVHTATEEPEEAWKAALKYLILANKDGLPLADAIEVVQAAIEKGLKEKAEMERLRTEERRTTMPWFGQGYWVKTTNKHYLE